MKAITLHGVADVRVQEHADPRIQEPTDALVRITTSAICGSDLHYYHGRFPNVEPGIVLGHEFVGEVVEVGAEVRGFRPGDRVVAPFSISCGRCEACKERLPAQCQTTNRAVFGGRFGRQYPGAQASFIRVPFADFMFERVPAGMPDEQAIFLGDILATGYFCAESGGIRPGDQVAVVGCGPVGLLAIQSAQLFGPARVFAVDRVDYRLALAEAFGAVPVDASRADPVAAIRAETGGRGVPVAMECVGHASALETALGLVKAGGTVSVVGVYAEAAFPFPISQAFFGDLTFKIGICNARNYITRLLPLVQAGRLVPTRIVSHVMGLAEGPRGYRIFDRKEERAIKVLLKP
ncbi:MAG: alcohol dehydrogenase catalytic domain-containing protein [Candidatus Rokubacteria bacterium]|nr:alcohol dehydrogenase catalytic domain-containing protein [Candidatus Rokubacteria bacterium]